MGWLGRVGTGGVGTRLWYSGVRDEGSQAGVDEVQEGLGIGVPVAVKRTMGSAGAVEANDGQGRGVIGSTKGFPG
jgi:hypothetical protein